MKKVLTIVALISLFLIFEPVLANQNFQPANVINIYTGKGVASIVVPAEAIEHSKAIIPLGNAFDNGQEVEGFAFIHYKKQLAKKPPQGNICYAYLANGAKWKVTESYVVASDVEANLVAQDLEAWDSQVAFEIFGNQDTGSVVDGPDTQSPDGKNEIMFGEISEPGVIAVTIVWGVFSGPPSGRKLVEYDVVFDNIDYVWGDAIQDPSLMDFENIATHEFGHAAGMADLYTSACSEQTMYGYADIGEIKKRILESGDIVGIKGLYK